MRKVNSRHIQKVEKNVSDLNEIKKLKQKHFRKKDRNYLFDKIDSFEKKIKRVLRIDLNIVKINVSKLEDSKKEIEKISKIVNELIVEINEELRSLEHKKKLIVAQKLRLLKKSKLLKDKLKKLREVLSEKNKNITSIKKLKKKI